MRIAFVTLFSVVLLSAGSAQELEVGVFGGGSYYLGDLNPSVHFRGTGLAYGVVARYTLNTRWALKFNGYRGKIKGNSAQSWFLPDRNLSFSSPVTDISAVVEFNFLPYFTGSQRSFITPFVYAGIGMFFFNPSSNGVKLQPLGTEGQQVWQYPPIVRDLVDCVHRITGIQVQPPGQAK